MLKDYLYVSVKRAYLLLQSTKLKTCASFLAQIPTRGRVREYELGFKSVAMVDLKERKYSTARYGRYF